jgi:predicted NAD/FAD-binding protein
VAQLAQRLPRRITCDIVEPLCVAALNTPTAKASAAVFLRVLRDALFSGAGSADLLLPRRPLGELLPEPALRWLEARGAGVRLGARATALERVGDAWRVDAVPYDAVVLACGASEAARLTRAVAPDWSAASASLEHEPIVTVYFESPGSRLPRPMVALREGPAQFVFDRGALGDPTGLFAAVVSAARPWVERGAAATARAVLSQLLDVFGTSVWRQPPRVVRALTDKRATFSCTPWQRRPPQRIATSLVAAGDYVEGPHPATLEGAVRSGVSSIDALDAA